MVEPHKQMTPRNRRQRVAKRLGNGFFRRGVFDAVPLAGRHFEAEVEDGLGFTLACGSKIYIFVRENSTAMENRACKFDFRLRDRK